MTFLRDHHLLIYNPAKAPFAQASAILFSGLGQAHPVKKPIVPPR